MGGSTSKNLKEKIMQFWNGVFPAVTTKMTEDGKIDPVAMKASIDH